MSSTSRVFLVTGCSAGLGLALSRAVLQAGQKLIATSRHPSKTPGLVKEIESKGGKWLALDTTSPELETQFIAAKDVHGRIDVLINNAGIGIAGDFEHESMDRTRNLFETNVFGVIRLTQMVLPDMRARHGGAIVNISSAVVTQTPPGLSAYVSSKWAVEGLTEVLAGEVGCFGIKVVLAIPGAMRTNFVSEDKWKTDDSQDAPPVGAGYENTPVQFVLKMVASEHGRQPIDPFKAAEKIINAVDGTGDFANDAKEGLIKIPIGNDTGEAMSAWLTAAKANVEKRRDVWTGCNFSQ